MSSIEISQTTQRHPLLESFARERIIGIVRTDDTESALWAASQLLAAGLRLVEISFTVPKAEHVIETLASQFPQATLGAGTILDVKTAIRALAVAARFLMSPVFTPEVVRFAREQQLCMLPGCLTPTEIYDAYSLGAPAIKFFPAQPTGGAEFIKALKGPFPEIPIVPTGGILKDQVKTYLEAGALAVGVGGSSLIPAHMVRSRDAEALQAHARHFLETLN